MIEMRFGLGDTDRFKSKIHTCWDIFAGDEDFKDEKALYEHVRIVLEDIAGLSAGRHFVLYKTDDIPEAGYEAVLAVCEAKGINFTCMRKYGPGSWDWEPQEITFSVED